MTGGAWCCPTCFRVHWAGEAKCARCGGIPGSTALPVALEPEPEPVLVHLPPHDFPFTRVRAARRVRQDWLGPVILLSLSLAVAVAWDPVALMVDAAAAVGGTSTAAEHARRAELLAATTDLQRLIDRLPGTPKAWKAWKAEVLAVVKRRHVEAGHGSVPALADANVRTRAAVLSLVSIPADTPVTDVRSRARAVREELSRVSEDLANVR